MQLRHSFCLGVLAALLLCVGSRAADAGVITSVNQFILPGFSTGSLTHSLPVSPNNDDLASASPNTIATGGLGIFLNADGFGILDYEFNVAESGGTTEYFFTTNVVNNTGVDWHDFHFQLGFGTGENFVPVGDDVGLDFDTPAGAATPTSTVFPLLDYQAGLVDWSGATVNYLGGPGAGPFSVAFSLSLDIPDGLAALNPEGAGRFTLRSFPTAQQIPEPATILLIGVGLLSVAVRRRG